MPWFLGSGVQVQLVWVLWLKVSHKVVVRLLARARVSSGGSAEESSFLSSLMWFLAGLSSWWVAGLRALAPCWLLAGASLSSLPHGPLHRTAQSAGFPQGTSGRACI